MDEPRKTGHVYPAGAVVFHGSEGETVYRERNALLVKALRSGNFVQARGALETVKYNSYKVETTGNCCLGVACRVAAIESDTFSVVTRIVGGQYVFGTLHFNDVGEQVFSPMVGGYPPHLVYQWFGWYINNPDLWASNNIEKQSAAYMNDNAGDSFETIADAFERTFVTFTYKSVNDLTDDTETTVTDLPE